MTDLDVLNELLKASPAVRRAMKAYLHKAFQRGQRYGERTAREMFDELLHRVHTVSHLNGATEIFKAQWDESAGRGTVRKAFNPNEPRDESGKWTSGGASHSRENTGVHEPDSSEGILSQVPESLEEAEDLAFELRDRIVGTDEDVCATSGDCITATAELRRANPDAEIWRGIYPGEWEEGGEHRISKVGNWFIDVTADQFDGPDVVVFSEEEFEEAQLGAGKFWKYGGFERYEVAEKTTDELNKKGIAKAFRESDHPRDHGRFASAPGSSGESSAPASTNRIEHPTDKHARTLAERIRSVPKRIRVKVAYLVRKKYEGLVEKFGKNGARAIIGASLFMLPVPLPGASMIPIALAHAVLKIRNLVSGPSLALVKAVGPEPTRDELERAAREFIEGIYRDMGEEPPEIPEELDLDDAGEPEAEEIDIPESSSGESDESPDSDSRMTESGVTESDAVALAMPSATQEIEPLLKARDSSGHEHRGKGPGGGQFTSGGDNGGSESTPAKSGDNRPPQAKDKSDNGERKVPQFASREEHAHAIRVALAKATAMPKPTKAEAAIARRGIKAYGGANAYRKSFVGNSNDRAARRKKLQKEFGDGTKCPCVYCAILIGDAIGEGTLEQDKIYTTAEGGRYKISNLIPSCSDCNKVRSDKPFSEFIKGIKPNG